MECSIPFICCDTVLAGIGKSFDFWDWSQYEKFWAGDSDAVIHLDSPNDRHDGTKTIAWVAREHAPGSLTPKDQQLIDRIRKCWPKEFCWDSQLFWAPRMYIGYRRELTYQKDGHPVFSPLERHLYFTRCPGGHDS
jgi:hypothetical protein